MTFLHYLLALVFLLVCTGAGFLRPAPLPWMIIRGLIVLSSVSLVAFFAALWHLPGLATLTTWSATCAGVLGWVVAAARLFQRRTVGRFGRHAGLLAIALALAVAPVLAFYGPAAAEDPFEATQNQLLLPYDNFLPALLAQAAASGDYPTPMIGDWLGSTVLRFSRDSSS